MPRKTLKDRNQRNISDTKTNRVRMVIDNLLGTEDADDIMLELLEVLTETTNVPSTGKCYTFVYKPKTIGITYDEHPLVGVTEVYAWGFKGVNFHWGEMRQYTWEEVVGELHLIRQQELKDVQALPFKKVKSR